MSNEADEVRQRYARRHASVEPDRYSLLRPDVWQTVQERQRAIQIRRNAVRVGTLEEAMVEGFNSATGQWIGRTSQNFTLNFTRAEARIGSYLPVRVTRAGPNSLAGEAVN